MKNNKEKATKIILILFCVSLVLSVFANFSSNKVIQPNDTSKNDVVQSEETEETNDDIKNGNSIENNNDDIIVDGNVLANLSDEEKVETANEIIFDKEFKIDGKTYTATKVAVENTSDNYLFYEVADVDDETVTELMLINLSGDIESNLASSFLCTYYYLQYEQLNGERLDTEFNPIDVQVTGNVFKLTNDKVDYDFMYAYKLNGDTYTFTEVN